MPVFLWFLWRFCLFHDQFKSGIIFELSGAIYLGFVCVFVIFSSYNTLSIYIYRFLYICSINIYIICMYMDDYYVLLFIKLQFLIFCYFFFQLAAHRRTSFARSFNQFHIRASHSHDFLPNCLLSIYIFSFYQSI